MFSTLYGTYFSFQMHFKMSSAIRFNVDLSKILSSGNGLKSCNKIVAKNVTVYKTILVIAGIWCI